MRRSETGRGCDRHSYQAHHNGPLCGADPCRDRNRQRGRRRYVGARELLERRADLVEAAAKLAGDLLHGDLDLLLVSAAVAPEPVRSGALIAVDHRLELRRGRQVLELLGYFHGLGVAVAALAAFAHGALRLPPPGRRGAVVAAGAVAGEVADHRRRGNFRRRAKP
jgi:hypothetical protein